MPPIDPTTRAIIAFIEVGVIGGVLALLIFGKFRHDREVKREELATAEANARTVEADKRTAAAEARSEKVLVQMEKQTDAFDRLTAAVEKLVASR